MIFKPHDMSLRHNSAPWSPFSIVIWHVFPYKPLGLSLERFQDPQFICSTIDFRDWTNMDKSYKVLYYPMLTLLAENSHLLDCICDQTFMDLMHHLYIRRVPWPAPKLLQVFTLICLGIYIFCIRKPTRASYKKSYKPRNAIRSYIDLYHFPWKGLAKHLLCTVGHLAEAQRTKGSEADTGSRHCTDEDNSPTDSIFGCWWALPPPATKYRCKF